MLERVPEAFARPASYGLFLTIAGTASALGPWVMGWWTDLLGPRAHRADRLLSAPSPSTPGLIGLRRLLQLR